MSDQIVQFVIADGQPEDGRYVDIDLRAQTAYIGIAGHSLLAAPSDIDWLIKALTKAKNLIEGEQA